MVSKKVGEASFLKVFDIKNLGIVAGAHVKSGRFIRDGKVIVWRGKQKVGEGLLKDCSEIVKQLRKFMLASNVLSLLRALIPGKSMIG